MTYSEVQQDHVELSSSVAIDGVLTFSVGEQAESIRRAVIEFCTPTRTQRGGFEDALVESGTRATLSNGVQCVIWGEGPRTLLVHGWCGRGTQMGGFVKPLLAAGKSVIAIDCWGHGESPGTLSHGVKFAECISLASDELGPFESAICHSVGGAALLIAISGGVSLQKAVLLAPPSISAVVREFAGRNHFTEHMTQLFIDELALESGLTIDNVDLVALAPRINVPILVMHDEADTTVSFRGSEQFVQKCSTATLQKVAGVGHLRIMRAKAVISQAVDFVR